MQEKANNMMGLGFFIVLQICPKFAGRLVVNPQQSTLTCHWVSLTSVFIILIIIILLFYLVVLVLKYNQKLEKSKK